MCLSVCVQVMQFIEKKQQSHRSVSQLQLSHPKLWAKSSSSFLFLTFDLHRYVLIDTPGQIEVFTWSASGTIITEALVRNSVLALCSRPASYPLDLPPPLSRTSPHLTVWSHRPLPSHASWSTWWTRRAAPTPSPSCPTCCTPAGTLVDLCFPLADAPTRHCGLQRSELVPLTVTSWFLLLSLCLSKVHAVLLQWMTHKLCTYFRSAT